MKKFIYGLMFGMCVVPILDELILVLCGYLEILKTFSTKKILKENKIIQELQVEQEPIATQAMGFQYYGDEEYYYEDDTEDKKSKNKIGFL